MGCQINPSWRTHIQPVLNDWCNNGCGMFYPACGMVHIKQPLLLIGNSNPWNGSSRFPLCYRKEGNVLFNDALNTFYLWLYGIRHMVKDHSDIERGNPLPPHRLLFPISSKGSFICTIPDRIAHTIAFVTPVVEHWLTMELHLAPCYRNDLLPCLMPYNHK